MSEWSSMGDDGWILARYIDFRSSVTSVFVTTHFRAVVTHGPFQRGAYAFFGSVVIDGAAQHTSVYESLNQACRDCEAVIDRFVRIWDANVGRDVAAR